MNYQSTIRYCVPLQYHDVAACALHEEPNVVRLGDLTFVIDAIVKLLLLVHIDGFEKKDSMDKTSTYLSLVRILQTILHLNGCD